MRLSLKTVITGLAGVCFFTAASAFNLSPCLRVLTLNEGKLGQEKIRRANQCDNRLLLAAIGDKKWLLDAVHEHQTLAAIRKYRNEARYAGRDPLQITKRGWKYQYMVEMPWAVPGGRTHQTHALVYGTWWNDDPVMLSWGQDWDFAFGSSSTLWPLPAARYKGGTAGCYVNKEHYFGLASHEGSMQYLHFMSSDPVGTEPQTKLQNTIDRALRWMKFAYEVATGDMKPETAMSADLTTELAMPAKWQLNHCKPNRDLRALFTRVGWKKELRDKYVPDIALGTMLHIVQDSFSPAHACRVGRGEGAERIAVLVDVANYADPEHNKNKHKELDRHPTWILPLVLSIDAQRANSAHPLEHTYRNDPVAVGAMLLSAVDEGRAWTDVEAELRDTIFKADRRTPAERDTPCIR